MTKDGKYFNLIESIISEPKEFLWKNSILEIDEKLTSASTILEAVLDVITDKYGVHIADKVLDLLYEKYDTLKS